MFTHSHFDICNKYNLDDKYIIIFYQDGNMILYSWDENKRNRGVTIGSPNDMIQYTIQVKPYNLNSDTILPYKKQRIKIKNSSGQWQIDNNKSKFCTLVLKNCRKISKSINTMKGKISWCSLGAIYDSITIWLHP